VSADDFRFVVETWLDAYRDAHAAGLIQWDDWHDVMRPQLLKVLARPGVATWVAAWAGEEPGLADLAGWISVERGYFLPAKSLRGGRHLKNLVGAPEPLVHFVYVKAGYRKGGIARGLFRAAEVDPGASFRYTCKTGIVTELAAKVPLARWAPLIARRPKRQHVEE
jgi:GNAT superfamily N-acetyltransferase